ncbi:hypothetical protein CEXT_367391, partial [Caerostris extrusa]
IFVECRILSFKNNASKESDFSNPSHHTKLLNLWDFRIQETSVDDSWKES